MKRKKSISNKKFKNPPLKNEHVNYIGLYIQTYDKTSEIDLLNHLDINLLVDENKIFEILKTINENDRIYKFITGILIPSFSCKYDNINNIILEDTTTEFIDEYRNKTVITDIAFDSIIISIDIIKDEYGINVDGTINEINNVQKMIKIIQIFYKKCSEIISVKGHKINLYIITPMEHVNAPVGRNMSFNFIRKNFELFKNYTWMGSDDDDSLNTKNIIKSRSNIIDKYKIKDIIGTFNQFNSSNLNKKISRYAAWSYFFSPIYYNTLSYRTVPMNKEDLDFFNRLTYNNVNCENLPGINNCSNKNDKDRLYNYNDSSGNYNKNKIFIDKEVIEYSNKHNNEHFDYNKETKNNIFPILVSDARDSSFFRNSAENYITTINIDKIRNIKNLVCHNDIFKSLKSINNITESNIKILATNQLNDYANSIKSIHLAFSREEFKNELEILRNYITKSDNMNIENKSELLNGISKIEHFTIIIENEKQRMEKEDVSQLHIIDTNDIKKALNNIDTNDIKKALNNIYSYLTHIGLYGMYSHKIETKSPDLNSYLNLNENLDIRNDNDLRNENINGDTYIIIYKCIVVSTNKENFHIMFQNGKLPTQEILNELECNIPLDYFLNSIIVNDILELIKTWNERLLTDENIHKTEGINRIPLQMFGGYKRIMFIFLMIIITIELITILVIIPTIICMKNNKRFSNNYEKRRDLKFL